MIGVLVVLVMAALPVLGIRLVNTGAALLPVSSPQRQFAEAIGDRFPVAALARSRWSAALPSPTCSAGAPTW